jgi:hypothetical protein
MALTGEYTDSIGEILPKAIKRINALPPVTPQYNISCAEGLEMALGIIDKHLLEPHKQEGDNEKR